MSDIKTVPEIKIETPQYRLVKPFYADDTYFPEGTIIEFDGTPNEQMEPLNASAMERSRAYIEKLNEGARQIGRDSRHLADIVFQEVSKRPREPAREVSLPKFVPETPPMGNLHKPGLKPVPKAPTVTVKTPEVDKGPAKPIAISSINKDTYNVD